MDIILYFRDFTLSEYSYGATPMGPILSVNGCAIHVLMPRPRAGSVSCIQAYGYIPLLFSRGVDRRWELLSPLHGK